MNRSLQDLIGPSTVNWTAHPIQSLSSAQIPIAQRERLNHQLRIEVGRLELAPDAVVIVELAPDAIVIVDAQGCIQLVNRQTEVLFRYGRHELIGRSIEVLIPERYHAGHAGHRAGYQREPCLRPMGAGLELFGRRKDASEFPVEISLSPVEIQGQSLVTSVIRDISERKQFEQRQQAKNLELEDAIQAKQHLNDKLEAAIKELEAFSYSISHDLRAPLRAVNGFSKILLEEHAPHLSPEAQGYLRLVSDNALYMGLLIDGLLMLSRLSSQPLQMEAILTGDVVRSAVADLLPEQAGRAVNITISELLPCRSHPTLLKQVFVNLLSNALKFTRRRQVADIEVGCRQADGEVIYFVRDNGTGFDMRFAHKVFGVFQRLHRAEDYDGTGVGLAIVQRIVQRHGGRIWATAAPDQGATFSFTLVEQPRVA